MIIRPMVLSDLPYLVQIDAQSNQPSWSKPMFERELELPFSLHAIAEEDTSPIAFGIVWKVLGTAQLIQFAVLPGERKKGIGTQLLKYLMQKSKNAGCDAMELEFSEKNIAAEILYKKLGFKNVGVRKNFYPDSSSAVLMECRL